MKTSYNYLVFVSFVSLLCFTLSTSLEIHTCRESERDAICSMLFETAGYCGYNKEKKPVGISGTICQACTNKQVKFVAKGSCEVSLPTKQSHFCQAIERTSNCVEARTDKKFCAWHDQTIKCFIYPCARTVFSICEGCKDKTIERVTEGECPKPGSFPSEVEDN